MLANRLKRECTTLERYTARQRSDQFKASNKISKHFRHRRNLFEHVWTVVFEFTCATQTCVRLGFGKSCKSKKMFSLSIFLNPILFFAVTIFSESKKIVCSDGSKYFYKKLCICTGSSPNLIDANNEYVLGIRDTESVLKFQERIKNSRRIVIVGNGGIATELVYEIENCKVIWAIKDKHACNHLFFDEMASRFFTKRLNENKVSTEQSDEVVSKRKNYSIKSKTRLTENAFC